MEGWWNIKCLYTILSLILSTYSSTLLYNVQCTVSHAQYNAHCTMFNAQYIGCANAPCKKGGGIYVREYDVHNAQCTMYTMSQCPMYEGW